jgi:hypothetical protein
MAAILAIDRFEEPSPVLSDVGWVVLLRPT